MGKINEYTIFNIKDHRNPDPDTDRVIVDPFDLPRSVIRSKEILMGRVPKHR